MAANGLKFSNLAGEQRPEKIVTLLLLFVLLTAAIAGVTSVLASPNWTPLWRGLIFGLLIGWALAVIRQPAWRSALLAALLGVGYGLFHAGGLRQSIFDILRELIYIVSQANIAQQGLGIDFSTFTQLLVESLNEIGAIIERVSMWVIALAVGEPSFDPVATTFVWIMLAWVIAAWAGWVAIAQKNGLLAVLPAILLSVGALSFGRQESITIYLMLGVTLILMATVQHARREQEWDEIATAYPPRKGRHIGNAALILSAALVLLTAMLSSISIPRIVEWIAVGNDPVPVGESGLAESLGIVTNVTATPDVFADVRHPGLPQDTLIGSGPELSKRIVMTVAVKDYLSLFKGEQAVPLYWRSLTYDDYTGHGWQTSDTATSQYPANQVLRPEKSGELLMVEQVVRWVDGDTTKIYAAGEPVMVNQLSDVATRSHGDLFGISIGVGASYMARSLIPIADEKALRTEGQEYPDWVRKRFLSLPSDLPGRVNQLALQLTASELTPYDRVRAIEGYLRNFPYTLDVPYPPLDRDVVDYFLFDLQQGYCDYYASAMVVLARAAGVPARLAVGYANGIYNLNAKRFLVSEADAHSWVEVYFPKSGWVPFEPTAGRPPIERSEVYAPTTDSRLIIAEEDPAREWTSSPLSGWLVLLGLVASFGVFGAIWAAYDEVRLHRLPEGSAAIEIYQRLKRYGRQLAVISEPGETPYEFAASLRAKLQELSQNGIRPGFTSNILDGIPKLIDKIVEASYRPSLSRDEFRAKMLKQWKTLRWQLRLMGLVNYYRTLQDRLRGIRAGEDRNHTDKFGQEE